MSRKYLNERWCVRCGKMDPTPFLKEMYTKHMKVRVDPSLKVLDIGCGNGRNSKYFYGADVKPIDMATDYGDKCILGKDKLPGEEYDVILANYVLMFLNEKERKQVIKEIDRHSCEGTRLVLEMYAAKDAHPYNWKDLITIFKDMGWGTIVNRKDHALLIKYS